MYVCKIIVTFKPTPFVFVPKLEFKLAFGQSLSISRTNLSYRLKIMFPHLIVAGSTAHKPVQMAVIWLSRLFADSWTLKQMQVRGRLPSSFCAIASKEAVHQVNHSEELALFSHTSASFPVCKSLTSFAANDTRSEVSAKTTS